MELENRFGITDYVIFGLSLLASLGIGIYSAMTGRRQKTTDDFYFGSRELNVVAVALSMAATFLSAIAILGFPAEVYFNGISIALMLITDTTAVLFAVFLFIPFFYNLGLTSVYEYFEHRFSGTIRRLACLLFIFNMLLYMSIVLFAPSLAMSQGNDHFTIDVPKVSGLPLWVCIVTSGLVCTAYTSFGGMKAVVWTDAFQMGVMFFGVLTILIVGVVKSAGFAQVWADNQETGRLNISFDPNPTIRHTFWTLVFGGFFQGLPIGLNQATVQRYFSVKSKRAAQQMFAINWPVVSLWKVALWCVGLLMVSYYRGCDPLLAKRIQRPDQISALYVLDIVSFIPGFAGLFTAIVCSATLSTVSSGVNSIVVVINEDFVRPFMRSKNREGRGGEKFYMRLSQALSVVVGCATIGIAFGASFVGRGLVQFSFMVYGMCGGPLLALFFCGMMLPFCNSKGVGIGLIAGLGVIFWVGIGSVFTHKASIPLLGSTDSCPSSLLPDSRHFNMTFHNTADPELDKYLSATVPSVILEESKKLNCSGTGNVASQNCFRNPEGFGLKTIYSISYQYYSIIGFTVTVVVASIVSLLTGRQKASNIPDQFLLYKLFRVSSKKETKATARETHRPYEYSSLEGLDMKHFEYDTTDDAASKKPNRNGKRIR
ncbi:Sodium-coupled monocarboxylate transporter 1 [Hypsibius exemplaris]|uniref:Sodium-coupled monocarboxylate transporter 1 n=1 Tax=Hypsibius exemplaris TaxID=2072580 RepID=A0A9X6RJP6_HYPEX|nr:Sodium-coupled monocarboxylate transporter 1 [Hypsibius exemplaris]